MVIHILIIVIEYYFLLTKFKENYLIKIISPNTKTPTLYPVLMYYTNTFGYLKNISKSAKKAQ